MIETYDVRRSSKLWFYLSSLITLTIILGLWSSWFMTRPPGDFPVGTAVTINRGLSAAEIVAILKEQNVVRSSLFTNIILITWYDPANIKAGSYYLDGPLTAFEVVNRITQEASESTLARLTLPEGFTAREYAVLAADVLSQFDGTEFLNLTATEEGKLFPDTYYLPVDFTAEELFKLQETTYREKIEPLQDQLTTHRLGEYGVITLASILEREGNTEESMRTISGILQKRLDMGMRLQTDASMEYVLGRPLGSLTAEDLERDTPYNTYLYAGLPPTPIGNPGLTAIEAVLNPLETDYLYYITDEEGNFHYAETFDEHKANIAKYLK